MNHFGCGPCTCGARLEDIPLVRVLAELDDGTRVWEVAAGTFCDYCGRPLPLFEEAATLELPAQRVAVERA